MDLIQNLEKDEFNYKGKIFVPLFNKEIDIEIEFNVDINYAEKCAQFLVNLSNDIIDNFCDKAMKYYKYMLEEWKAYGIFDNIVKKIEKTIPKNIQPKEILKYINPYCVYIEKPKENLPAFVIGCECVWEPEHGLKWIQRDNKVLQVTTFDDDMGPWEDEEDYKTAWD